MADNKTGNPFVDALAGKAWPAGHHTTTSRVLLNVNFADDGNGGNWTPHERTAFMLAANQWSNVAQISFRETHLDSHTDLVERKVALEQSASDDYEYGSHGMPTGNVRDVLNGAFNTRTDSSATGGAYWTDQSRSMGGIMFETFVHEIGHAIGLNHPHGSGDSGALLFPGIPLRLDGSGNPMPGSGVASAPGDNSLNNVLNTIMSYNEPKGNSAKTNPNEGFAASPMAFDIAAIQHLYGAVDFGTGNNTYLITDALRGFHCIWDTGGNDTIKYEGSKDVTIELRAATLANEFGGGGRLSSADGMQAGYTIAGDFTNYIADQNGDRGVIIENATGGSGDDTLIGNAGNNGLVGGAGADDLDGRAGNDSMRGGTGDDTYRVSGALDRVFDVAGTAGGHDRMFVKVDTWDMRLANKGLWIEDIFYHGGGSFIGDGNDLGNIMKGGKQADTLRGNNGHDKLYGNEGLDRLDGGEGNDELYGGTGSDVLVGGIGHDMLFGSIGDDHLFGDEGNDELHGGTGINVLVGGTGRDTYYLDKGTDKIVETTAASGGTDLIVTARGSYNLEKAKGVENLTFTGNAFHFADGSSIGNVIIGGDGIDVLHGWGGDDRLIGGSGRDSLHGGQGRDVMIGDAGDDDFFVDNGNSLGGDVVYGGSNYDTVRADTSVNVTGLRLNLFSAGVTNLSQAPIANTSKAAGVEEVIGGKGNDVIDGSRLKVTDTMVVNGLGGEDTYFGGLGADIFDGGTDTDTFVLTGKHSDYKFGGIGDVFTLTSVVSGIVDWVKETELFKFADGIFHLSNLFISGSEGGDRLTGDGFGNTLDGGSGDDTLDGGRGRDTLLGGEGDDILITDNFDVDIIDGGTGYDQVYASVDTAASGFTFTLTSAMNVEGISGGGGNDVLDASAMTTGVDVLGHEGDDVVTGGSGNDVLEGGADNDVMFGETGADTLIGGADNDTLNGGADGDLFAFADGWGHDVIVDFNFAEGDKINLFDVNGLDSFAQLTIATSGDGADVIFGADSIHLAGVTANQVQDDWFVV